MAAKTSTIRVKVVGDLKGFNQSMDAGSTKIDKFASAMGKLKIPVLLAGAASFKLASDFDSSMSKITGLVGIAADEVDSMGESLKGISSATAQGPAELAEALFFVTSAGLRGAEAMDALEFAAKASTAGLGETADAADALTSAMNAYAKSGLSAEDATNILVATVREGKLEASELGASIGQVLPIASEMGVTFDEVGASIAAMTRLGLNSAESVTSLKSILSTIAKPASAAAVELEKVGLSSAGLRTQLREEGLLAVLFTLREAFEGNAEGLTKVIPNVRALTGFMALTGDSAEATIGIFDRLTDTTGTLDAAFDTAADTIEFRFNKAITDLKLKALEVRDPLTRFSGQFLPIISDMTHEMTLAVRGVNAIKDGVIEAETPVDEFAAAIKFMGGDAARADESLRFMIAALGIGSEEFNIIAGNSDKFSKAAGLTREELARLLALIKLIPLEELARDFQGVQKRTDALRDAVLDGLDPALNRFTETTRTATAATKVQAVSIRDLRVAFLEADDPILAVSTAMERAETAQRNYDEALEEFGETSKEADRLNLALAAANSSAVDCR